MEDFIARENVARFKEKLRNAKDGKERALLEELLAAAEAKLASRGEARTPGIRVVDDNDARPSSGIDPSQGRPRPE